MCLVKVEIKVISHGQQTIIAHKKSNLLSLVLCDANLFNILFACNKLVYQTRLQFLLVPTILECDHEFINPGEYYFGGWVSFNTLISLPLPIAWNFGA
jgi:hypothetical protein